MNLRWALDRVRKQVESLTPAARSDAAHELAVEICDEDVVLNQGIGTAGLPLIRAIAGRRKPVLASISSLNAMPGWLAHRRTWKPRLPRI